MNTETDGTCFDWTDPSIGTSSPSCGPRAVEKGY